MSRWDLNPYDEPEEEFDHWISDLQSTITRALNPIRTPLYSKPEPEIPIFAPSILEDSPKREDGDVHMEESISVDDQRARIGEKEGVNEDLAVRSEPKKIDVSDSSLEEYASDQNDTDNSDQDSKVLEQIYSNEEGSESGDDDSEFEHDDQAFPPFPMHLQAPLSGRSTPKFNSARNVFFYNQEASTASSFTVDKNEDGEDVIELEDSDEDAQSESELEEEVETWHGKGGMMKMGGLSNLSGESEEDDELSEDEEDEEEEEDDDDQEDGRQDEDISENGEEEEMEEEEEGGEEEGYQNSIEGSDIEEPSAPHSTLQINSTYYAQGFSPSETFSEPATPVSFQISEDKFGSISHAVSTSVLPSAPQDMMEEAEEYEEDEDTDEFRDEDVFYGEDSHDVNSAVRSEAFENELDELVERETVIDEDENNDDQRTSQEEIFIDPDLSNFVPLGLEINPVATESLHLLSDPSYESSLASNAIPPSSIKHPSFFASDSKEATPLPSSAPSPGLSSTRLPEGSVNNGSSIQGPGVDLDSDQLSRPLHHGLEPDGIEVIDRDGDLVEWHAENQDTRILEREDSDDDQSIDTDKENEDECDLNEIEMSVIYDAFDDISSDGEEDESRNEDGLSKKDSEVDIRGIQADTEDEEKITLPAEEVEDTTPESLVNTEESAKTYTEQGPSITNNTPSLLGSSDDVLDMSTRLDEHTNGSGGSSPVHLPLTNEDDFELEHELAVQPHPVMPRSVNSAVNRVVESIDDEGVGREQEQTEGSSSSSDMDRVTADKSAEKPNSQSETIEEKHGIDKEGVDELERKHEIATQPQSKSTETSSNSSSDDFSAISVSTPIAESTSAATNPVDEFEKEHELAIQPRSSASLLAEPLLSIESKDASHKSVSKTGIQIDEFEEEHQAAMQPHMHPQPQPQVQSPAKKGFISLSPPSLNDETSGDAIGLSPIRKEFHETEMETEIGKDEDIDHKIATEDIVNATEVENEDDAVMNSAVMNLDSILSESSSDQAQHVDCNTREEGEISSSSESQSSSPNDSSFLPINPHTTHVAFDMEEDELDEDPIPDDYVFGAEPIKPSVLTTEETIVDNSRSDTESAVATGSSGEADFISIETDEESKPLHPEINESPEAFAVSSPPSEDRLASRFVRTTASKDQFLPAFSQAPEQIIVPVPGVEHNNNSFKTTPVGLPGVTRPGLWNDSIPLRFVSNQDQADKTPSKSGRVQNRTEDATSSENPLILPPPSHPPHSPEKTTIPAYVEPSTLVTSTSESDVDERSAHSPQSPDSTPDDLDLYGRSEVLNDEPMELEQDDASNLSTTSPSQPSLSSTPNSIPMSQARQLSFHQHSSNRQSSHIAPAESISKTRSPTTTPSRSQRVQSKFSSPVTRSQCKYHVLTIPDLESDMVSRFIVPSCSMSNVQDMTKECARVTGEATLEENQRRRPLIGEEKAAVTDGIEQSLTRIVGIDLVKEGHVFFLDTISYQDDEMLRVASTSTLSTSMDLANSPEEQTNTTATSDFGSSRVKESSPDEKAAKHPLSSERKFSHDSLAGPTSPNLAETSEQSVSERLGFGSLQKRPESEDEADDKDGEDDEDQDDSAEGASKNGTSSEELTAGDSSSELLFVQAKRKRSSESADDEADDMGNDETKIAAGKVPRDEVDSDEGGRPKRVRLESDEPQDQTADSERVSSPITKPKTGFIRSLFRR